MTDPIILPTDDAAAPTRGECWIDRHGGRHTHEATARWANSTHKLCSKCGVAINKNSFCRACTEVAALAKFLAMPTAPWDGEAMLYSEKTGHYYYDGPDEIEEFDSDGNQIPLSELRLVICEPEHAEPLEISYWADQMPDDGEENPEWLVDLIDDFNASLALEEPLSWTPGKFRLDVSGEV